MKEKFEIYLEEIRIDAPTADRVREIFYFHSLLFPGREVDDIFISQLELGHGEWEPDTLVFFSQGLVFQIRHFVHEAVYQSFPIKCSVFSWELRKRDYNFDGVTSSFSRLTITFAPAVTSGSPVEPAITYRAMGPNCNALREVLLKYIIPNTNLAIDLEYQRKIAEDVARLRELSE